MKELVGNLMKECRSEKKDKNDKEGKYWNCEATGKTNAKCHIHDKKSLLDGNPLDDEADYFYNADQEKELTLSIFSKGKGNVS